MLETAIFVLKSYPDYEYEFQVINATGYSVLKKTIDSISGKNNGINKLGKKERKKQKGAKKKMEKLQDKKESTNNGK